MRLVGAAAAVWVLAMPGGYGTSGASEKEEKLLTVKVSGGTWVPQGPAPALFGQAENISQSPVSGAIETVVAHPTDPDVVWIGAVNGGIFRTDNATAASPSWTQQTDAQASLSIGALDLDPTDATHNTLVAGIGRTSSLASLGGARTGLLRTTDGGAAWGAIGAGMAGRNISGVAARGSTIVASVDVADSFTCSNIGIFRSTNTGSTFGKISLAGNLGLSHTLAGNPLDNSQLFTDLVFSDLCSGLPADGLYRSSNTGSSWSKVSNAAIDALFTAACRPTEVEIAVGRAGTGTSANVFAAVCSCAGALAGLFRSGDGGGTWTALDLPTTTETTGTFGIHPGAQCGPHLSLVADPNDPDVVYIGGDRQPSANEGVGSTFPNSIGASTFGGRLFRVDASATPGSQATSITNCPAATAACGGAVRTVNDTAPHADSRDMVFDANGDILETDDGGIYKHTDPSGSTGNWVSIIGDLRVIEQHDGRYDTVSDILFSGNQDNGTTTQTATGNTVWTQTFGGDGGDVAVGKNDPLAGQSTRYMSAQGFQVPHRRVYNAANVQQSAVAVGLSPLGGAPAPTGQFVTPIKVHEITPTRLLLGAGNGLYESLDRLDSVSRLIAGFPVNFIGGGTPIAYGTAADPNAFYYVTSDDVVLFTVDTAPSASLSDPDPGTDSTAGVVMDPADSSVAFVIDTNQVFRTTNSGAGWTDVTGNLQSFNPGTLRSIEYIESASDDRLVVGAGAGVFVAPASSGFSTWDRLGTGLPNAPVFDLDYDAGDDVLAASTLGRGAWTLSFASFPCVERIDLVQGQWKQISLACDPGASNTVADVFGDDLSGTYNVNWVVYRRDAAGQSNVKLATTDTLAVGEGYWIKTNLAGQSVGIEADDNPVTDVALVSDSADPPAGCASSAGRCDMAGHPHKFQVCWADAQIIDGASTLSLSGADPSGACQAAGAAGNGCVMSRIAHKWNGSAYAPFDGQTPGMEGTLVPWDGFFVSAVKSGIDLRIPASEGDCGAPKSAGGWFVRLIAESGDLRDATNVLGQLADSADGYDAHDLEELPPFGNPFLTVVFPHDDWGEKAGAYASDFHRWASVEVPDQWSFEVRSSETGATVTLRWEGADSRLLGSILADDESGAMVTVEPGGGYSFVMNGTSRSFRWISQGDSSLIFADDFESGNTAKW